MNAALTSAYTDQTDEQIRVYRRRSPDGYVISGTERPALQ